MNATDQPTNFTDMTTNEPLNFTEGNNMTTDEASKFTDEVNSSTSHSTGTITSTNSTTRKPGVCDDNPCENGGTCIETNKVAKCKCAALYDGETCTESYWCNKGEGKGLCRGGAVFTTSYPIVDQCPFMSIKCTNQFEECKNGMCQCKDNFIRNDKQKCVPNFCALNPCRENEVCQDLLTDPGNVKCSCKKGFYYDGNSCQRENLCSIPSIRNCEQVCNSKTESCECHPGFTLQPDKKSCEADNVTKPCEQECIVGICVTKDSKDICVCPATHVAVGLSCVDLCTAKKISKGLCPNDDCLADDKLAFKCKCEGKYAYDQNGITCRRKLMCSEGDGSKTCAKYKARCVEDYENAEGYRCACEPGQAMDRDGICKNKCEVEKQKEECDARKAICEMDGFEAVCKCPPLLTIGSDGICSEFAKVSYIGELPLARNRYYRKKLMSGAKTQVQDDSINYDAIRKDLRASIHMLYGNIYKFADIVNCRISDMSLNCLVEVQFQSDPQGQVNRITDTNSCFPTDENSCFIPPLY
ncbi:matrilin-3 [Caerostris extrusa]|uniref:Matrilin-3 n=1 Tax=Caerostris extrusa TaxID=172846 RepID=A0AAV4N7R9_CAEEX|nr:matrilin-3 [Caerostris extrusa]